MSEGRLRELGSPVQSWHRQRSDSLLHLKCFRANTGENLAAKLSAGATWGTRRQDPALMELSGVFRWRNPCEMQEKGSREQLAASGCTLQSFLNHEGTGHF